MTPDEEDLIRRRQRARALITGILLAGLALLIFLITLTRIKASLS